MSPSANILKTNWATTRDNETDHFSDMLAQEASVSRYPGFCRKLHPLAYFVCTNREDSDEPAQMRRLV